MYSVSAVVWLQFMVSAMLFHTINVLYFYISTSLSTCAVPNMAVLCSSLIPCYPGMLHRYCLCDSEMVPINPVTIGVTSVVTFHTRCVSIARSLHFQIFSASFLITFI